MLVHRMAKKVKDSKVLAKIGTKDAGQQFNSLEAWQQQAKKSSYKIEHSGDYWYAYNGIGGPAVGQFGIKENKGTMDSKTKDGEYGSLKRKLDQIRQELARYKRAGQDDSHEYKDLQREEGKIMYALMAYINKPKDSKTKDKYDLVWANGKYEIYEDENGEFELVRKSNKATVGQYATLQGAKLDAQESTKDYYTKNRNIRFKIKGDKLPVGLKKKVKDATNYNRERSFQTFEAWKRACKQINPSVVFEGDKDICQAKPGIGEWDGNEGIIYTNDSKTKDDRSDERMYCSRCKKLVEVEGGLNRQGIYNKCMECGATIDSKIKDAELTVPELKNKALTKVLRDFYEGVKEIYSPASVAGAQKLTQMIESETDPIKLKRWAGLDSNYKEAAKKYLMAKHPSGKLLNITGDSKIKVKDSIKSRFNFKKTKDASTLSSIQEQIKEAKKDLAVAERKNNEKEIRDMKDILNNLTRAYNSLLNKDFDSKTKDDADDKSFDIRNIEKETIENDNFRKVLFTGNNLQLVLMSLLPNEDIGMEVHPNVDQFFRIDEGNGQLDIKGEGKSAIENGTSIVVKAGTYHNIIAGNKGLKLYTVYAPPNYPPDRVQKTKAEAMESEAKG